MPAHHRSVEDRYGAAHKRERERWAPYVEAGRVECYAVRCLELSRAIAPGSTWDLGHTPDGTTWTGPEHAGCNRSEGATRGNRARRDARQPLRRWEL